MDPYEHADISGASMTNGAQKMPTCSLSTFKASEFLETFTKYPPSRRPASFSIDQVRKQVDKVIDKHFEEMGK